MEFLVAGVVRRTGTGKTGRPFDFAQVVILRPVDPAARPNFSVSGSGYEAVEIECRIEAVAQLAQLRFPCRAELTFDVEMGRDGARSIVSGVSQPATKAA